MRIGATSDLHGYLPVIPADLDLLLIAGDIGVLADRSLEGFPQRHDPMARPLTLADFAAWLGSVECPVIGIAGNHDFGLAGSLGELAARDLPWTYLRDEWVEVDGLTVHGSPWTPTYGQWAFMLDDHLLADEWGMIPEFVDVLVTHGPPHGTMDIGHGGEPAGSRTLAERVSELEVLLHVFGHIHGSRGVEVTEQADYTQVVANVSYVDEDYRPAGPIMTFDI